MEPIVVDTDVISLMFKQDTRARKYADLLGDKEYVMSHVSVAELDRWTLQRRWGPAKLTRLEEYIGLNYTVYYPDRILCRWWAIATSRAARKGRPISAHDAWVAAAALAFNVPLVTNNPRDFQGVDGLEVLSI